MVQVGPRPASCGASVGWRAAVRLLKIGSDQGVWGKPVWACILSTAASPRRPPFYTSNDFNRGAERSQALSEGVIWSPSRPRTPPRPSAHQFRTPDHCGASLLPLAAPHDAGNAVWDGEQRAIGAGAAGPAAAGDGPPPACGAAHPPPRRAAVRCLHSTPPPRVYAPALQQPQIILLKEGTDTSQGKPQLISNINACYAVADVVRTTLGPRGMDKLMHTERAVTVSNDGATIMKTLDIVHPAAKTLVDISLAQDAEVGGCCAAGGAVGCCGGCWCGALSGRHCPQRCAAHCSVYLIRAAATTLLAFMCTCSHQPSRSLARRSNLFSTLGAGGRRHHHRRAPGR